MSEQYQVVRGFLANIKQIPPVILTFKFNPESVTDKKAVQYADGKVGTCGNAPGKIYTGGGHRTITFKIELHGLEDGGALGVPFAAGVATELAKLRSFLYPAEDAWGVIKFGGDEGKVITAPGTVIFGFGPKILECVVTDIDIEEKQFNHLLIPVRASASVSLAVIEEDGSALYELDKQQRNILAALGLANIDIGVSIF